MTAFTRILHRVKADECMDKVWGEVWGVKNTGGKRSLCPRHAMADDSAG